MTDELDVSFISFTKLLENLKSIDAKVRSEAAMDLGGLGDARAVAHLIEALNDRHLYVWQKAVEALQNIGEEAVLPLIEALKDDTMGERELVTAHQGQLHMHNIGTYTGAIRESAAIALGKIKDTRGIEPLIERLQDEHWAIRLSAVEALGRIGDERAVEPLQDLLDKETSNAVKFFINRVLPDLYNYEKRLRKEGLNIEEIQIIEGLSNKEEHFAKKSEHKLIEMGEKAIRLLLIALKEKSRVLRLRAIRVLGEIGGTIAVVTLIELLGDEKGSLKETVIESLGKIGDESAIGPLIKELKNENSGISTKAGSSLMKLGTKAILPLIKLLEDKSSTLRAKVVGVLGTIKDPEVVDHIIETLYDSAKEVRKIAASMLGYRVEIRAIKNLIETLNDEKWEVRKVTAWALGEIGDKQAIPPLIEALKDSDCEIRQYVVPALGRIGGSQVIDPLFNALEDEDKTVRRKAALQLKKFKSQRMMNALFNALKAQDKDTRIVAIEALGNMGDTRAVPSIIIAHKDVSPEVREKAASALEMIGERAVPKLFQALQDEDLFVRKTAVLVLLSLGKTLEERGDEKVVEALIEVLREEYEVDVKKKIVVALGKEGSTRAIEALIEVLEYEDEHWKVIEEIIEVLVEIREERAVEPLIKMLHYDSVEGRVNLQVVEALGKIGEERAVEPNYGHFGLNEHAELLLKIIEALGKIGDERAVLPLIEFKKDKHNFLSNFNTYHPELGEAVDEVFRSIGDPRGVAEIFVENCDSYSSYDYDSCIEDELEELSKYLGDKVFPLLIELLKNDRQGVKRAIRYALGSIKDKRVVKTLLKLLENENENVRNSVACILGDMRDERAVEPLLEALKNRKWKVRKDAIEVLGNMGDERVVEPLQELLIKENNDSVISVIEKALQKLKKED